MRCDAAGEEVLATYETRVRTVLPVEAEAAALNGYNEKEWEPAPLIAEALESFVNHVVRPFEKRIVVCGHNVKFDADFVRIGCEGASMPYPFDYHHIDTVTLAWPLLVAGKIKSLRLGDVCDYFGISNEGEHHAMVDVERDREIYRRFMKAYVGLLL